MAYEAIGPLLVILLAVVLSFGWGGCGKKNQAADSTGGGRGRFHIPIVSDIGNFIGETVFGKEPEKEVVSETVADPFAWARPWLGVAFGISLGMAILPLGFRREGIIGIATVGATAVGFSIMEAMRGWILLVGMIGLVVFFGPSLWWRLKAIWTAQECVHRIKNGATDDEKQVAMYQLAEAKDEINGLFGAVVKKLSPTIREADNLVDWTVGPPLHPEPGKESSP